MASPPCQDPPVRALGAGEWLSAGFAVYSKADIGISHDHGHDGGLSLTDLRCGLDSQAAARGCACACSYSGSGARSMPSGHTTVPASVSTATWAKYSGSLSGSRTPVQCSAEKSTVADCAVTDQEPNHVVTDHGDPRHNRQVVFAHVFIL